MPLFGILNILIFSTENIEFVVVSQTEKSLERDFEFQICARGRRGKNHTFKLNPK